MIAGGQMTAQQNRLFYIYGRVQGVGFRYQTYLWAKKQGLKGYVLNREDGSVKLAIYGTAEEIEQVNTWLLAGGPFGAKIDHFFSEKGNLEAVADFNIRH